MRTSAFAPAWNKWQFLFRYLCGKLAVVQAIVNVNINGPPACCSVVSNWNDAKPVLTFEMFPPKFICNGFSLSDSFALVFPVFARGVRSHRPVAAVGALTASKYDMESVGKRISRVILSMLVFGIRHSFFLVRPRGASRPHTVVLLLRSELAP